MALEYLSSSTAQVTTTNNTINGTLSVHASADYVLFFIAVQAPIADSDASLVGGSATWNGDAVSLTLLSSSGSTINKKYRLQLMYRFSPDLGSNTFSITYPSTSEKNVLMAAMSYRGVSQPAGTGLLNKITQTETADPTYLSITVGSNTILVDGIAWISNTDIPIVFGPAQELRNSITSTHEEEWGLSISDKIFGFSGTHSMSWANFPSNDWPHPHIVAALSPATDIITRNRRMNIT